MLVLTLVLGMSVVGCATTPPEPTKFDGRWLKEDALNDFTDYSFTFTGNKWSFKSAGNSNSDENFSFNGTFTFTDTTITFKFGNASWEQEYTLSGGVLTLEEPDVEFAYGTFTKQ